MSSTVFSTTLTSEFTSGAAYTIALNLASNDLASVSGNAIRITFACPVGGSATTLSDVFIGHKGGSNDYSFDGNQVRLTFNGSNSVTLGVGAGTVTSDWISFPFDHTKELIVSYDNNGSPGNMRRLNPTGFTTAAEYFFITSTGDAHTQNKSGYTPAGDFWDAVQSIEVTAMGIENASNANANGTSTGGITVNTSGTDRICVLMIMSEDNNGSSAPTVTSVTSSHVTWARAYATQNEVSSDFSGHINQEVWVGFASTQLSSEAITVNFSTGTDGAEINFLAISGAAETSGFLDPNGSLPAVSVSSTPAVTASTTNNDNIVLLFGATGSRSGAITGGTGFTTVLNYNDHSPSSWDIVIGVAAKIVTAPESSVSEAMSSSAGQIGMVAIAITGDVPTGVTGTMGPTEAADTMTATGTGQPAPPTIDATFGELTGHTHSLTSPLAFSFSGTNKAAGGDEYFLALIGTNLRSGTGVSVSSVTVTGLTFVHLYTLENTTSGQEQPTIEVWGAPASSAFNSAGANLTYTVNYSGGTEIDGAVACIVGVQGLGSLAQPFDPDASLPGHAFNTSSAVTPTVTFNTTNNHDLLLGLTLNNNPFGGNQFPIAPSGWTLIASPNDNSGIAGIVLGVNTKSVTSAQTSATFKDAATGSSAAWTEMVLALTGDPPAPITGTMAHTEAKDVFAGTGLGPPPIGMWASTETKDHFSGFEAPPLGIDTHATGETDGPGVTVCHVTLSTNFDNEVIVVTVQAGGHFLTSPPHVVSITDTAGLVWKKRNQRWKGGSGASTEIWWAFAPTPLSADVITITCETLAAGAVGMITASAIGVVGANTTTPWDLNVQASGFIDTGAAGVGAGDPVNLMSRNASMALDLAIFSSVGAPAATADPVTSPFTGITSSVASETSGDNGILIVSGALNPSPDDSLQVAYGAPGGGGFSARSMMTDTIVAAGEPGTADPVLWYFDGFLQTTLVLGGGATSAPLVGFFNSNTNIIIQCAILVQSASGLGAVSGIVDSGGLTWVKRSSVRNSTGQLDLEVWYALCPAPFNGGGSFPFGDTITVSASGVIDGDSISFIAFGIGGGDQFTEIFDPDASLPAVAFSDHAGESAATNINTENKNCVLLAITANLVDPLAGNDVRPYHMFQVLASGAPIINMGIEYNFTGPQAVSEIAEFNTTPASWVMIADALPVGPPLPPVGTMGAVEHPDILTHTGNFTFIGIASPGGWVCFVPIDAVMAATDAKDVPHGTPVASPYFGVGWLGCVPAFATMAATGTKDRFSGGGWVIGEGITARMNGRELPDRMAASNISVVTGTWHSTGAPDRFASAGFLIPKVTPPTPGKRRVLIVS